MKTILVIEDDVTLADIYKMKFEIAGHHVLLAGNGVAAMKFLSHEQPDLVLLDIVMPKMDGFSFLQERKKKGLLDGIKVIVLSNLGEKTDIDKSMELGADDYIVKARSSIDDIVKKIETLM